ncbi:MAG: class I SAM-dependent methyltransferase [bacterium]|nr:class I SAM-dependent methyltransferase [bacterium]
MLCINKCLDIGERHAADIRYVTMDIARLILKSRGLLSCDLHRRWFEYSYAVIYSQLSKGLDVLDVGSQNSALPYYINEIYRCKVTSIDLYRLKERCGINEFLGLSVCNEIGDVTGLRYADNTFDRIFCVSTIEHIKDDTAAMLEMKRVLRPGGMLILTTDFGPEYIRYPYGLNGTVYGVYKARRYDEKRLFERIIYPSGMEIIGEVNYKNVDLTRKENLFVFGKYTFATLFLAKSETVIPVNSSGGFVPKVQYDRQRDLVRLKEEYPAYLEQAVEKYESMLHNFFPPEVWKLYNIAVIIYKKIADFLFKFTKSGK